MNNKVAIVTGGSSGIGKAIAHDFAQKGAKVVITGRSEEKLLLAKKDLETYDGQIQTVVMDVRKPEDAVRMVEETIASFGTIDFLVNNAAGNFVCPAEDLTNNGWNSVVNIVLNGTFHCSQAAGKYWIKNNKQGSILNIVATYAWLAAPGVVHSASAKAGVLAMTRTLAVEWGSKYGIRVNAIAPGPVEGTVGVERLWADEKRRHEYINSIPLKRTVSPEEIAEISTFLFSKGADYINGECITVDGGQWLASKSFLKKEASEIPTS